MSTDCRSGRVGAELQGWATAFETQQPPAAQHATLCKWLTRLLFRPWLAGSELRNNLVVVGLDGANAFQHGGFPFFFQLQQLRLQNSLFWLSCRKLKPIRAAILRAHGGRGSIRAPAEDDATPRGRCGDGGGSHCHNRRPLVAWALASTPRRMQAPVPNLVARRALLWSNAAWLAGWESP